ncbi:hypothetical protein LEP1GSC036_2413 [Leptospira weilii str. 2006001853]|uniref:Uncharacterized protein n=1 Tax=Leptospira weilii str. 2006001853 TaxID=1001589 RepID=A0A828YZL6_9LEPT|nr:hypothetical protein LEP1GSC036_2413 [Leptospira weilii str. 2006001853]EMN45184.1 hypothetical protein LEP1GSC086_1262 [Leptospira weilii str. LNT 1234]QDK23159.1 hypothetical protein FHG67_10845 [Leptospira weilii]QDK27202.1 hypothetical protein FHG68_11405 [Leptospira weilii]
MIFCQNRRFLMILIENDSFLGIQILYFFLKKLILNQANLRIDRFLNSRKYFLFSNLLFLQRKHF